MSISPKIPPKPPAPRYERKRCKNCPKFFLKTKPWKEFCSTSCRRQFHDNNSAWGKLRDILTQHLEKELARVRRELRAEFVTRAEIGAEGLAVIERAVARARDRVKQGK